MAFKVKKSKFDWDLELDLIPKEGEAKGETVIIKCVKVMNSEEYAEFVNYCQELSPKNESEQLEISKEISKDIYKGIALVINQIDYLYEKGEEWWKKNVDPETIMNVQRHLVDFTNALSQKKST